LDHAIIAMPDPSEAPPAEEAPGGGGGFGPMMFPLLIVVLIFMLMPLFNKKERQRKQRMGELKKHDKIVTTGGIFGTIVAIDEQNVTIEVSKDVRIKVRRTSIYDIVGPDADAKDKS
jgi:preprotein translocase subunit YajC